MGGQQGFSRVVRVEIAAHAHATEDVNRVVKAILSLLPDELRGSVEPEIVTVEGHHGNPITRIVVRLEGRDAERFLSWLGGRLGEGEKLVLRSILEQRYDERSGRFYFRVDKQEAYLGSVRFSDGDDVIQVMINMRGSPRLERALKVLEELGLVG